MKKKSIFESMFCYLVGPIDTVKDGGKDWRRELTPFLQSLGVHSLDPTNKKMLNGDCVEDDATLETIKKLREDGKFSEIKKLHGRIRTVDLRMVDLSSFTIVKLDYTPGVILTGTLEELFLSNQNRKPTLVFVEGGDKRTVPLWIYYCLPHYHIFSTIEEIKQYLLDMNEAGGPNEEEEADGRWKIFDFQKICEGRE